MISRSSSLPVVLRGLLLLFCRVIPTRAGDNTGLAFSPSSLSVLHHRTDAANPAERRRVFHPLCSFQAKSFCAIAKSSREHDLSPRIACSSQRGDVGYGHALGGRRYHVEATPRLRMSTTSDSETQEQSMGTIGNSGETSSERVAEAGDGEQPQGVSEDEGSLDEEGTESGRVSLPNIVNPFKVAFDAGRQLRMTIANNLEQITGAPSPVRLILLPSRESRVLPKVTRKPAGPEPPRGEHDQYLTYGADDVAVLLVSFIRGNFCLLTLWATTNPSSFTRHVQEKGMAQSCYRISSIISCGSLPIFFSPGRRQQDSQGKTSQSTRVMQHDAAACPVTVEPWLSYPRGRAALALATVFFHPSFFRLTLVPPPSPLRWQKLPRDLSEHSLSEPPLPRGIDT